MSVKSSFISIVDAARGIALLQEAGMTHTEWQEGTINNPFRSRIIAAIRNEPASTLSLSQLCDREVCLTKRYCDFAEIAYPGDSTIEQALTKAQSVWGSLTEHDRFISGGIGLGEGLRFFRRFNAEREKQELSPLRLNSDFTEERWPFDSGYFDVEYLPTETGVIHLNFTLAMQPTDLIGSPFYLNTKKHHEWAMGQGGDGLTSGEENLILFGRSVLERGLPLWASGHARCRNITDRNVRPSRTLTLIWDAKDGMDFCSSALGGRAGVLGGLSRKFVALGA